MSNHLRCFYFEYSVYTCKPFTRPLWLFRDCTPFVEKKLKVPFVCRAWFFFQDGKSVLWAWKGPFFRDYQKCFKQLPLSMYKRPLKKLFSFRTLSGVPIWAVSLYVIIISYYCTYLLGNEYTKHAQNKPLGLYCVFLYIRCLISTCSTTITDWNSPNWCPNFSRNWNKQRINTSYSHLLKTIPPFTRCYRFL